MQNNFISNNDSGIRDTYLASMREMLDPNYRHLDEEQVAYILHDTMAKMPPMERDTFAAMSLLSASEGLNWKAIKNAVAPVLKVVAPLIGNAIGGPVGGVVGNLVSGNLGNVTPRTRPAATASDKPSQPMATTTEPGLTSIANQLMALLNNPAVNQVLGGISPASATPAPSAKETPQEEYFVDEFGNYFVEVVTTVDHRTSSKPSYDPRYWYFDTKSRQWRRRTNPPLAPTSPRVSSLVAPLAVTPPQYDPRYWYFDTKSRQWRRRANSPLAPAHPRVAPVLAPRYVAFPPQTEQPMDYPPPSVQYPEPDPNLAASQLMALISNPQFLQAMIGQSMGNVGNGNISVQQGSDFVDIPFGAMMNTLIELGQQAAEESVRAGGDESEKYLMDSAGNYGVEDPSNPEERARYVMEMLREDHEWRNRQEEETEVLSEAFDPVTEWLIHAGMV